MTKTLTPEQAKKYYDGFGAKQDSQGFYENKPIGIALEQAAFDRSAHVFEFGCGTGKRASELFKHSLSTTCLYTGQDISDTMVSLAKEHLAPWEDRVNIRQSDGSVNLPDQDETYDRFFSTYVLDLLSDDKIEEVLQEAKRVLKKEGKLCLVGITTGKNIRSKIVSTGWSTIFKIRPSMVGGCRPLNLTNFIHESDWSIEFHTKVTATMVASEIVVAIPKK